MPDTDNKRSYKSLLIRYGTIFQGLQELKNQRKVRRGRTPRWGKGKAAENRSFLGCLCLYPILSKSAAEKIRHFSFSDFNSFLQSLHFVQNNGQNAISRHTSIFLLLRNSVHRKYIFK